jgi:hypothetical protein
MQCSKRKHWLPPERMEEKATCLSVFWIRMQDKHQRAHAEERVLGNKMSMMMMLFIGTRFSNLYTAVDTQAWAAYHSQARRPRAAHKRRLAARDTTSESDEGEEEGSDWDECYGVRMSPENPQYVAQGTAHVGGRWCILSPRSGYFCVLNQTTRSVGSPRVRWGGLSQGNGMRPPMRKTNETANRLRGN